MKNRFEIHGEYTVIFLCRRDGTVLETLIDTDDLPKVQEFQNSWCSMWSPDIQSYYVVGNRPKVQGRGLVPLHRWLLEEPEGLHIDHINHDTLDNRRKNLRAVTIAENQQNRKGLNSCNTSGILGVFWHKLAKKWMAQVRLNNKKHYLGLYEEKRDAEKAVRKFRGKTMKYANG